MKVTHEKRLSYYKFYHNTRHLLTAFLNKRLLFSINTVWVWRKSHTNVTTNRYRICSHIQRTLLRSKL